ncbi:MAG TPA: DinB family protein [Candidatus Dormibacteraeota bacterium]|nr:DinB family protein [Candidatus Dormibacteraeota bacterium]
MTNAWRSLAALAALPDAAMEPVWTWREGGVPLQVRDGLYHALESEQAALVEAAQGPRQAEVAAILDLANRALGDLLGLCAGLDDEVIDREPAPGEWPLREVLRHVLEVELSYRANTVYALTRAEAEPLETPAARRARPEDVDARGTVDDVLGRIAAARSETDGALIELVEATAASGLDPYRRPTLWARYAVDVRFRLHRFASHLVEHTVQCEKALHALGLDPGEARQIVRAIGATRGAHQARTAAPRLLDLDREIEALATAAGAA